MMTRRLNRKPAKPNPNARQYGKFAMISPAATLPTKVDKRKYCSIIEDQGDQGSCTAHANAGVVEWLENVELAHKLVGPAASLVFPGGFQHVSRSMIYYNEREAEGTVDEDSGAMLSTGVQVVENIGVCRETLWPYSDQTMYTKPSQPCYDEAAKHKVLYAYQLNDIVEMKHCLAQGYPFVFGVTCYDSFLSDTVAKDGIVPMPGYYETPQGGHALSCFGYDDNMTDGGMTGFFLFRNSWGTGWGQMGYGWIPYAYLSNPRFAEEFYTYRYSPAKV